ncbi:MAG: nucleotidyl transferase family protein [Acidimicrobiales bacterium]
MAVGVYPGSFCPPTIAHLAVVEAARRHAGLERVDLVISESALGKEDAGGPTPEERLEVLLAVAASREWIGARLTESRLIADIAAGYDVVVMGADKWAQIRDPVWYGGSVAARDAALARLPRVLIAPRGNDTVDPAAARPAELLDVDARYHLVSSTAARSGRSEWILPEALDWARPTGAWNVQVPPSARPGPLA